jgi:hypothetical protein
LRSGTSGSPARFGEDLKKEIDYSRKLAEGLAAKMSAPEIYADYAQVKELGDKIKSSARQNFAIAVARRTHNALPGFTGYRFLKDRPGIHKGMVLPVLAAGIGALRQVAQQRVIYFPSRQ